MDALPYTARRLQGQQQVGGDRATWRGSHGDLRTLRAWHATPAAATLAFYLAHSSSGEAQQTPLAVLPRDGASSATEVPTLDTTVLRSNSTTSLGVLSQGVNDPATTARGNGLLNTLTASSGECIPRPARRLLQLLGPWGRTYVGPRVLDFNGLTWYAATPSASGSLSVAGDAKFKLSRDGTLNVGAGFATAQAFAANPSQGRWWAALFPSLSAGSGPDSGGPQDPPATATAAWSVVPRFFECCSLFPSRSYVLAEASTAPSGTAVVNGYYFISEVGYNPLSNSFGASTSQAQAGSVNLRSSGPGASRLVVSRGDQSLGFAGVEAIGSANQLVNFADPRVEQYGQVIAYPYNIFTPYDPITCAQTLVTGAALTGISMLPPRTPVNDLTPDATLEGVAPILTNLTLPPSGSSNSSGGGFIGRQATDASGSGPSSLGAREPHDTVSHGPPESSREGGDEAAAPGDGLQLPSQRYAAMAEARRQQQAPANASVGLGMRSGVEGDGGGFDGGSMPPAGLVPFCMQWFNLQTLDDYRSFLRTVGPAYESDYYDNGYGYSDAYDPGLGGEAVAGPDEVGADLRQQDSTGQGPQRQQPETAGGGEGGGGGGGAGPQYRASVAYTNGKKETGGPVSYEPASLSKVVFVADESDASSSAGLSAGTPGAYRSSQVPTDQGEQQQPTVPAVGPAAQALQDRVSGLLQGNGLAMGLWAVGSANASVAQRLAERAGAAATRLANTTAAHAGQAWQLAAEAAALRAEAVMRVVVRVADAASPLSAALLAAHEATYGGLVALSNAAVDAAISRLEATLPEGAVAEVAARAEATSRQLLGGQAAAAAAAQAGDLGTGPGTEQSASLDLRRRSAARG